MRDPKTNIIGQMWYITSTILASDGGKRRKYLITATVKIYPPWIDEEQGNTEASLWLSLADDFHIKCVSGKHENLN